MYDLYRLSGCLITQVGCTSLASSLSSSCSYLKELDLRYNHPGGAVKLLQNLELKTLRYGETCAAMEYEGVLGIDQVNKWY